MKILVDTGAWVALNVPGDRYHSEALKILEVLRRKHALFVVTDYILDETVTLMLKKGGHSKASALGMQILKSPSVKFTIIDQAIWSRAWEIFRKYSDKIWSFTDCVSFAVMDSLKIEDAFAFDNNFLQYGKRLLKSDSGSVTAKN